MSKDQAHAGSDVTCLSLLEKAFTIGFMVSREGFNGECAYEHCAPTRVEAHYESVAEFMSAIEKNEAFTDLRKSAISNISNHGLTGQVPSAATGTVKCPCSGDSNSGAKS